MNPPLYNAVIRLKFSLSPVICNRLPINWIMELLLNYSSEASKIESVSIQLAEVPR